MLLAEKNKNSIFNFSTGSYGEVLATTMMMMGGVMPFSSSLVESLVDGKS